MALCSHILAGFSLGFRQRHNLLQTLESTPTIASILELVPTQLAEDTIKVLALDFDGVLASHGSALPLPEAIIWLQNCQELFGGDRIFILSNKPTDERSRWFSDNFPAIRFIAGVRKKPYPDGLVTVAHLAGVSPVSVLMVDDRLLTGCLAALNAGARPCYIRHPFVSYRHRPLAEFFFQLLRGAERGFVRLACHL
jgi:predicted HAD superfamily phosphohydrolase YqeG